MNVWLLITALAVGTVIIKSAGSLLAGGRQPPAVVARVIALFAPALISALVVTGTVAGGGGLTLDARVAGVAVGAAALLLRAPLLVSIVLAALTCALIRLAV